MEEPTNFRPSIYYQSYQKILYKVISIQLTEYYENNYLLNKSQHAYRNNSCTEHALVNITAAQNMH